MRKLVVMGFVLGLAAMFCSCDFVDDMVGEWSDLDQYGGEKDSDEDYGAVDPDNPGRDCGDVCYYAVEECPPMLYGEYHQCMVLCDQALDVDENIPSDFGYKTCVLDCIADCNYYEDCIDMCLPELED